MTIRIAGSLTRLTAALLSAALLTPAAFAEEHDLDEAAPEVEEIDNIVVTGSKRDTALIDSDLSVTVIDAAAIDEARLREFRRIDDLVPNVQFNEFGQQGSIFITVRGVESNPFIVNRAAVYIDGIPFRELNNAVLNQIESIEVLRGPQGTLYGANTESGLIIVTTKAPTDELEGNVRANWSDFPSGQGYGLDGAVSAQLVADRLAGSFAFKVGHEDAYVKNLGSSIGETGHIDDTFLQGRLRWTPTDRLTINATAYWLDIDAPGLFDQQYVPLDLALYNSNYGQAFNGGRLASDWIAFEDAPKYTRQEEIVAGLSAEYRSDFGYFDFALSYRDVVEDAAGLDFDLTAAPFVAGQEADSDDYTNLEIRFSSPDGELFDYIVGASYYESTEINTKASFLGSGDLSSYIAAPPQQEDSEDVSFFGSANWYVSNKLRLSGGLRYERASRSSVQRAGELDIGFGDVIVYPNAELDETFDELLPRLSAHYKVTDDFSVHASVARGYIPGGFNLVAVQQGFLDDTVVSYDSETLWSREIGFKWRSNDRRVRVAGAIFYIDADNWQEIQVATDADGRPVSSDFVGSDASIRSQGLEAEVAWNVTDALSIDAHLGYVDAEYVDLQLDTDLNARGQAIQFVPEYDAGLAIRYAWPAGFFLRLEAGFNGEMPLRARGDAVQEAVETVGFQIGYESQRLAARFFGENLTDVRRASGLGIENLAFGTDGLFYSPLDAPRIVGIEVEARF